MALREVFIRASAIPPWPATTICSCSAPTTSLVEADGAYVAADPKIDDYDRCEEQYECTSGD